MYIWENLQIYKHKTQNQLIPGQIQINTKHDTIFKPFNIENAQKANIYTTITHNNTSIKYQKPTGKHNNNQPKHEYSTRYKIRKAEDGNNTIPPKTCSQYRKIHLEVKKFIQ